jgi:signal transduction histidine kinase
MTEQRAARLSALESEDALLNAVIESLDEGIIAVNPRGETVRLNESARRLLGLTATVPFSMDLLPQERLMRDAMRAAMSGIPTEPSELALGDRTLHHSPSAPRRRSGARGHGSHDAPPAETIRRDFVANVSHELKTPLTVIGGFAETLRDAELPTEDRQRFLQTIESNTRRMQRIVDDLLDLSRYESGTWVPNIVSNDLSGIVSDAFTAVHRSAEAKGLALAYEGNDRRVDADPTALRQIPGNLVEAVRHTARGSITVGAEPAPDGGVAVTVTDTGSGIPPDHLARIFERFYRVDTARSRDEAEPDWASRLCATSSRHTVGRCARTALLGRERPSRFTSRPSL